MYEELIMKGVSDLIATILIVALAVAVAGLVSVWVTGFTRQSTEIVSSQANLEIICNDGSISFSDTNCCSTSKYFSGFISNNGKIPLGNITFQIMYTNGTQEKLYLYYASGVITANSTFPGNFSLARGEQYKFNLSLGSCTIDRVAMNTNCTAKVQDLVKSSDITSSC